MKNFCLSPKSESNLVNNFPKIRKDLLKKFLSKIDQELWTHNRLERQSREHLELKGFCGITSWLALKLLFANYPEAKVIRGYFLVDKYPKFPGQQVCDLHNWVEIGNKIVDFTASQFDPFMFKPADEVVITSVNDPRYTQDLICEPVSMDDDNFYLEHYINKI